MTAPDAVTSPPARSADAPEPAERGGARVLRPHLEMPEPRRRRSRPVFDPYGIRFAPVDWLKARQVSLSDTARQLGTTYNTLVNWNERGRTPLTVYKALCVLFPSLRRETPPPVDELERPLAPTLETLALAHRFDQAHRRAVWTVHLLDGRTNKAVLLTPEVPGFADSDADSDAEDEEEREARVAGEAPAPVEPGEAAAPGEAVAAPAPPSVHPRALRGSGKGNVAVDYDRRAETVSIPGGDGRHTDGRDLAPVVAPPPLDYQPMAVPGDAVEVFAQALLVMRAQRDAQGARARALELQAQEREHYVSRLEQQVEQHGQELQGYEEMLNELLNKQRQAAESVGAAGAAAFDPVDPAKVSRAAELLRKRGHASLAEALQALPFATGRP